MNQNSNQNRIYQHRKDLTARIRTRIVESACGGSIDCCWNWDNRIKGMTNFVNLTLLIVIGIRITAGDSTMYLWSWVWPACRRLWEYSSPRLILKRWLTLLVSELIINRGPQETQQESKQERHWYSTIWIFPPWS